VLGDALGIGTQRRTHPGAGEDQLGGGEVLTGIDAEAGLAQVFDQRGQVEAKILLGAHDFVRVARSET
jgi:hypothetical protein